jgi:hypothetical protein
MATTFHTVTEDDFIFQNAGIVLTASATITGDGSGSSIAVGKGIWDAKIDITVEDIALDGTNNWLFFIEANTKAATTTWIQLACLPADGVVIDAIGAYMLTFKNPYDHQVRLRWKETGTASLTFSSNLFPVVI